MTKRCWIVAVRVALSDLRRPVNRGATLPSALWLLDARGVNHSAADVGITVRGVLLPDGSTVASLGEARFNEASASHRFDVDTRELPAGTYTGSVDVAGDPVEH